MGNRADRQEYYINNVVFGEFGGEIETGDNPTKSKHILDSTAFDFMYDPNSKKKSIQSIKQDLKINEEDYWHYIDTVLYDLQMRWNKQNHVHLGFTLRDVILGDGDEIQPIKLTYKFIVDDFDKDLCGNYREILKHGFIPGYDRVQSSDSIYSFLCNFTDDELYFVLRHFFVTFSDMLKYLVSKYLSGGFVIHKLNNEKNWIDKKYIDLISKEVVPFSGNITAKFFDVYYDMNKFFKIKHFMNKKVKKVSTKRIDTYVTMLNSYLFLSLFYETVHELNDLTYYEEVNETNNTLMIYEDLYSYFYREIFV